MHPLCYFTLNAGVVIFCSISIIIPCCAFVLVALPERIRYPAEVRAPTTVAKTRIAISETRPQFGKRILEERRPVTHTHVIDDWFVLLDVGPKEPGIFLTCLCCLFFLLCRQTAHSWLLFLLSMKRFCSLLKGYAEFSLLKNTYRQMGVHSHYYSMTCDLATFLRLKKWRFLNLSIPPLYPH